MIKDKRGQMMVFNIMILVIVILVFMALIPVLQSMISSARGSTGLNCVSTLRTCNATTPEPCYNASLDAQTTSCLVLDIYLPYILIVVLIMSIAALMAGKSDAFGFGQQTQPQQYA